MTELSIIATRATWILLLYLGFTPPVVIEDWPSKAECATAGQYAIAEHELCERAHCNWECLKGPTK